MRRARRRSGSAPALGAVLAALVLALAAPAAAEVLRAETSERYLVEPGARVEIKNVNGDIELSSWDRPEVLVEATKVVKALGHSRAARALDELRIEVEHSPSELRVKTVPPRREGGIFSWVLGGQLQSRVSYRVTLPRAVSLEAVTVNGDLLIDSVGGPITARTTNGRIEIVEASAAAEASTVNGNIRAEFSALESGDAVNLRTTNGGIVVYLPSATAAEVAATTVNGTVSSDFDALEDRSRAWRRKSLRGALNGGGGQLTLETVNGCIQLRARESS